MVKTGALDLEVPQHHESEKILNTEGVLFKNI